MPTPSPVAPSARFSIKDFLSSFVLLELLKGLALRGGRVQQAGPAISAWLKDLGVTV